MAQQDKVNIALAKVGMDKDTHPSQLNETQYTHALNANVETESGNSLNITNEKSNILITRYKPGFVLIGFENDILSNDTYVLLVNPITGVGEFGVIKDNQSITNLDDITVGCNGNCEEVRELATPLENITQQEIAGAYTTLISDEYALDGATNICYYYTDPQYSALNLGFNFNVNYPIKKLTIKNEKCGKNIYFTDNFNPPRHINIENLDQYYVQNVPCADDLVTSCIDFNELRVFKLYNIPQITPASIQLGGRLKMGVYEFLIAYCDAAGNEISPYYSLTRPLSVFDKNNIIQGQENIADRTNFSIKLDVSGLDRRYSHYKVAVIQTADLEGATRYFVEGIHTINDTTVIYGSEQDKIATSIDKLLIANLQVEQSEGLTASNNILFQYGLTLKKEINLQPVVNLMGQFLQWQTHIAPETLYENGVIGSQYVGYNRDEVVPFSIRFLLEGGYETSIFPFIARVPNSFDLDELVIDIDGVPEINPEFEDTRKDVQSILDNILDCNTTDRRKRWQYYNTAIIDNSPVCELSDVEYVEVQDTITKTCIVDDIETIPAGQFSINLEDTDYTTLEEYINLKKEECPVAFFDENGNLTDLCDYLEESQYNSINCDSDVFEGMDCESPSIETEIVISVIENQVEEKVEKDFPTEYELVTSPKNCTIYKTNITDGTYLQDEDNPKGYIGSNPSRVYVRDSDFTNEDCGAAEEIVFSPTTSPNNNAAFFNNYYWITRTTPTPVGTTLTYTNKSSTVYAHPTSGSSYFYSQLSKNALWFKGNTEGSTKFIIDISKQKDVDGDDNVSVGTYVRMTLYKKCSDTTHLYSNLVNLSSGGIFLFEKVGVSDLQITNTAGVTTTIPNGWSSDKKFLIAVDTPIQDITVDLTASIVIDLSEDRWLNAPTDGCFSVTKRDVEYSRIDISWDSITLSKKFIYTATCNFNEPVAQACKALPFKKGDFAFWESEQTYPDNPELFDSTKLKILPVRIPASIQSNFESIFTNGLNGEFYKFKKESWQNTTKAVADFTCRSIRHFKFPDNKVAPFMYPNQKAPFGDSIIYPLGVTIDENVINAFLDIAVDNELISPEDRKKITKYEIFRGDISLERSVVASGMLFDMRRYTEKNRQIFYSNYPYNTYSPDILNLDSLTTTESIYADGETYQGAVWGSSNRNFTFHSPETEYGKPTLPSELSVQAYMYGNSRGNFDEVRQHPKWVILTPKADNFAGTLATLEVAGEILIKAAEITSNAQVWFMAGFANGASVGLPAFIAAGVVTAFGTAAGIVYKYGQYKYQWLKIIRDLGRPNNFASYYFSEGFYNYIDNSSLGRPQIGNQLRAINVGKYLNDGRFIVTNEVTREILNINNIDRERSVLLSTGKNVIAYPNTYKNYDKTGDSSLTTMSLSGLNETGRSSEIIKNIASPYAALKNYLPSQYGSINSVKWLTTSYVGDLKQVQTSCVKILPIFGGDTYITRHSFKRKMPLFLVTAMKQADLTPFNYFYYSNIGRNPAYYISYEINKTFQQSSRIFPTIDSDLSTDNTTQSGYYYVPPTKFYLYYYGIPNFLTETRINTNYRYSGKEKRESFYPVCGDLGDWTQETVVPIREPNIFKYNPVYSKNSTFIRSRTLKTTYNKEFDDCVQDMPNGIMASLPDSTENSVYDPWLIYRPLDTFEFPSNYGKLKDIIDVESGAILARFNNTSVLYNKIDTKIDTGSAITATTLGGNMFFQRVSTSFVNSKLGYGGTQNFTSVSCEAGHFWVDAKRGQVLMVPPNSGGIQEISTGIGGKASGLRNWFKEHLPFKILKTIPNADIDNPYNGVGITMGWDSRYRRVFITKKDYIAKPCVQFIEGVGYVFNETKCGGEATLTCPEGYTLNGDVCELVTQTQLCDEENGFIFNPVTGQCEKATQIEADCETSACSSGMDVVFLVDITGSMGNAINDIKSQVASIVSTIVTESGGDYRLGLVTFDEYTSGTVSNYSTKPDYTSLPAGQKFVNSGIARFQWITAFETMSATNQATFTTQLNKLSTTAIPLGSGVGTPEPSDMGIARIINPNNIAGAFRPGVAKFIIVITDAPPSGNNDDYDSTDIGYINGVLEAACISQEVRILLMSTAGVNALNTLAINTGGVVSNSFSPAAIIAAIEEVCNTTIVCTCPEGYTQVTIDDIVYCVQEEFQEPDCDNGEITQLEDNSWVCVEVDTLDPSANDILTPVNIPDPEYFDDVSWTIAFSLNTGSWMSYYSFYPNYYISHNTYFQTGRNNAVDNSELGLWSHLLTNRSYQVFYGKKYPFNIEYPIKSEYSTKRIGAVKLWTEAKRYSNDYDFSTTPNLTFNKSLIYNNVGCSGQLLLDVQEANLFKVKDYPKTNSNGTQNILITNKDNYQFTYDYIFNRIKYNTTNIPFLLQDKNQIEKVPNPDVVKFYGINPLKKMEGDWFLNRLTYDTDSRFSMTLKFVLNESQNT
jgi:phosphoribosyl-AMP cyclohydrolase